jgi:hypothetical protein
MRNYPLRSMPAETLHIQYSARPRGNRRRPKHPVLQVFAKLILWFVALGILIAVLIRIGVFQESERPVFVADCSIADPPRHL